MQILLTCLARANAAQATILSTNIEPLRGEQGQAIAMIIYFAAMIMIGIWAWTRTNTMDDYMLGGRELNPLVAALSAGAADMSGWLLMGLPGALYLSGMVEAWIAIGLTVGAWLNWKFVAARLRTYTEVASNSITVPSFLSTRLRDKSNAIRVTSGIIFFVFFTLYVASGLVAGGKFFESSFGMPYHTGMVLVAAIVVLYTLIGGFLAVSWTDMVQGLMMLAALVLVPVFGLIAAGGFGQVVSDVAEVNPQALNMISGTSPVAVISNLAWGLGYFGMPHIIVRFMALRTPQQARSARRIWFGWMILSVFGAVATAMIGISLNKQGIIDVPEKANETVFLVSGQALFPSLLAGFMLAAILAAIMSTVSSQLLVTSSAVVEDIYNSFAAHNVKEVSLGFTVNEKTIRKTNLGVTMGRVVVLLVTVLGAALAWFAYDDNSFIASSILGIVAFAWAGFGAAFGPVIILSLYWRRLSATGALWGMITGAVTVVLWHYAFNNGYASWAANTGLYEILPGFIVCLLVAFLVSLATFQEDEEIEREFAQAAQMSKDKEYTPLHPQAAVGVEAPTMPNEVPTINNQA